MADNECKGSVKSVWAFNNLEYIAYVESYGQLAVFSLDRKQSSFFPQSHAQQETSWS